MTILKSISPAAKPLVFLLCLVPVAWVIWLATSGGLGANPIEALNRYLGDWTLRFLIAALAITPLRHLAKWTGIVRYRRMIGLYAFFYATLHVSSYVALDQFFDWQAIGADIIKRSFITVGMATLVILAALAATSSKAMIKRIGGRNWTRLHRLVYVAGVGAVFHYTMMIKADIREPMIYAAILAVLLGYRIVKALRQRRPAHSGLTRISEPRPN